MEKKITDPDKYIAILEFNNFAAETFATRLKQGNLAKTIS